MRTGRASNLVRLLPLIMLGVLLSACGGNESTDAARSDQGANAVTDECRIAVAANLKPAMEDLLSQFRLSHPSMRVEATYGSSGSFHAQIIHGAPFDAFLSADTEYPRRLVESGHAEASGAFLYAIGRLAIWVRADSPIDVATLGMDALMHETVRRIAIANPVHAPYGRAAESAMKAASVHTKVESMIVLGENIAQAAQYVESGTAEVGLIALSLAIAPPLSERGRHWAVPTDLHAPIHQSGVILNGAQGKQAATQLRAFITGPQGRSILQKHGYAVPGA